jgi:hypothetical protein
MAEVVQRMRQRGLFASIDLHNNTGANPHYACVNVIDNRFCTWPRCSRAPWSTSSAPAGCNPRPWRSCVRRSRWNAARSKDQRGIDHARGVRRRLPAPVPTARSAGARARHRPLPHRRAASRCRRRRLRLPAPDRAAGALPRPWSTSTSANCRRHGLRPLPRRAPPLDVRDEWGRDVGRALLRLRGRRAAAALPVMPSMLTCDAEVIRQDCVCYLLERYCTFTGSTGLDTGHDRSGRLYSPPRYTRHRPRAA